MQVEASTIIKAPPERIFSIYEDVENWPAWDPDTKKSQIDGPFKTGAKGRLTPAKGNTVPMELTSVIRNKSFTAESRIPMFRMKFEHELLPTSKGTEVVHRVTFSGLLSFILGRVLAAQLRQGLPVTLASLKQTAEKSRAAAPRKFAGRR